MENLFGNRMEIFGEIINLFLMYHVLLFTDFVLDAELRYIIGYSFIFFTGVFISVHMFLMMKTTFKALKYKWRMKKKKKADAQIQKEAKDRKMDRFRKYRQSSGKPNAQNEEEEMKEFEEFENIENEIEHWKSMREKHKRAVKF